MYQKSLDDRKSRLRLEAAERKNALESMLKEDDKRRKDILMKKIELRQIQDNDFRVKN